MKWREENINSKDGTPEAAKTLDELMELANLEDIGDTKDVTFSNYPIHWDKKESRIC